MEKLSHPASPSVRTAVGKVLYRLLDAADCAPSPLGNNWCLTPDIGESGYQACAKTRLRLDGLFDAFFESYWREFTVLRSIALRCRACGAISLRILRRRTRDGRERVMAAWEAGAGEHDKVLNVAFAEPEEGESYLIVEIDVEVGTILKELVWETEAPPVKDVKVGVAITTFNREAFLKANLQRLSGRLAASRIIIVNHGSPGLRDRIGVAGHPDGVIQFIDQENSGGAGGFTRSMVEYHRAGDVTHVLLMDDDIDLPADLVERISTIFAYLDRPLCLGGAMFDYHDRRKLFTAGDYLVPESFGIGHLVPPEGCDIGTAEGVDFLARIHVPDFNGWWCFAFPIAAIDSVGLPMPCFIRGDDVEYGYRLRRQGWSTMPWPGLAVWHMPFAAKSAPWHMFYDRRNSLFTNALHRRVSRRVALKKLLGGFIHHLLRYDYDRVRAMTMGIEAFNAGAEVMAKWTHLDHARLIAATTTDDSFHSALLPESRQFNARRLVGRHRSLTIASRFLADLFWPWRNRQPRLLPADEIWRPDFVDRPALVVELAKNGCAERSYQYSWGETWRATLRYWKALITMTGRFDAPSGQAEIARWLGRVDKVGQPFTDRGEVEEADEG